jgi:phosphinothricin acetyltransferase
MTVAIRLAEAADASAICEIHNEGILDRLATLDTVLRTPDATRQWLAERGARHPVIVAEHPPQPGGEIVGWGSLNRFNPREAYDGVADFSVYVGRAWRGQGIGRQLLDRLIELARATNHHKMVLAALSHNRPGIALYTRAGFERVGIYRQHGRLDGKWVDVIVMEKLLTDAVRYPKP